KGEIWRSHIPRRCVAISWVLRPTRPPLQLSRSIDKSPDSSIERPARRGESLSEVRASPQGLARRGCSESEVEAAFLRLSASNSLLHPRLDNIGTTLKHHEAILPSDTFIIVSIGRFQSRSCMHADCDPSQGHRRGPSF